MALSFGPSRLYGPTILYGDFVCHSTLLPYFAYHYYSPPPLFVSVQYSGLGVSSLFLLTFRCRFLCWEGPTSPSTKIIHRIHITFLCFVFTLSFNRDYCHFRYPCVGLNCCSYVSWLILFDNTVNLIISSRHPNNLLRLSLPSLFR